MDRFLYRAKEEVKDEFLGLTKEEWKEILIILTKLGLTIGLQLWLIKKSTKS